MGFMFLFFFLVILFLFVSTNLLLSLLVLEILSLFSLFLFCLSIYPYVFSEYFYLILFSIFVIEGVIGISSMILLVYFSGSDYVSAFSVYKV